MSWFPHSMRAAAVLLLLGLTGCVTTVPGYRYTVETAGGDYYYDERPAAMTTTTVQVLPGYGAFGYSSPGGWYGSVGFGFGTYYGLGGYYAPSWGAFGPRYGYAGYWRPPYYSTPRYSRPHHYYRPPYRYARPLPWRSHEQNRWNRPPPRHTPGRGYERNRPGRGMDNRLVDGSRPGARYPTRPGRGDRPSSPPHRIRTPPARSAMPGVRESPRDMAVQFGPQAPTRRVRHGMSSPTRQPLSPPPGQAIRATDSGGRRQAGMTAAPRPHSPLSAASQPRRFAPSAVPQRQMQPSFRREAVTPSRSVAQPRPMPQRARAPMPPPPASRGPSRRGGGPQHER